MLKSPAIRFRLHLLVPRRRWSKQLLNGRRLSVWLLLHPIYSGMTESIVTKFGEMVWSMSQVTLISVQLKRRKGCDIFKKFDHAGFLRKGHN